VHDSYLCTIFDGIEQLNSIFALETDRALELAS
jgi:hypothetical protein